MNLRFTQPFNQSYEEQYQPADLDTMYLYSERPYFLLSYYKRLKRRHRSSSPVLKYGILLLILLLFSVLLKAADFPVTNTYDSGPGSLRQAINDVNAAGAGPHTIVFNVYGQITILSSLPQITKSNVTIDGQHKITLNSNGTNTVVNPFNINASNVTIRNFTLTNAGDIYFTLQPNTTGVLIENIRSYSTTGNFLNSFLYVNGISTNLTVRNITCTDIEPDGGAYPYYNGRGFIFVGGMQTSLMLDNINFSTLNNARGGEGIVFRDASVNGLTLTNTNISGFKNGIVLDNTGGPVETANNVLLRNVTIDSLYSGVALGIYSTFVSTNIQVKSTVVDLNVVTSTNDGDYAIRFDNTTNNVTLDTVTVKDGDLQSVWFNGAAQNITINHTKISDPAPGDGYAGQFLRFEGTANTVTIKNTILDADKLNTTDDADYGLLFIGATNGVTIDSLTVNEFDVDGGYLVAANTDFQLTNSTFTNNFDGIEFYNAVARTNVDIINSSFSGSTRSGIVVNAGAANADIDLTGDTVYNNTNHGIWIYGGNVATDMTVSGCVIHDNGGAGIYNDNPDKVVYTNNAIYNNKSLGIDNVTGNCSYEGVNRPVLVSSTALGGGQYQLVINLPAIVPTGYTVDVYANDPATSASSGQFFVTSLTGLSSGSNSRTITYNTGPGATGVGFWTATLRIPANNCGTSEFSDKLNIGMKAPACITAGILGWYRADMGVNGAVWGDISGNGNNMTVVGDPDDTTGLVNFNKAFYYDGNDAHVVPATAGVTTAYTMMGLAKLEGSLNRRIFSSSTGNKLFGWWGGGENGYHNEGWLKNTTAITNFTKLYSIKRANTGSGPYEFKCNGVLLSAGTASNGALWTLDVGGYAFSEYSKVFVPEVFIYNRDLTPAEIQRLESYMALKYGITLNNGNTDYVASDGIALMWTAASNTGYAKRITGIGRDDCTMLNQKQSLSADTGIVTMALGNTIQLTNAANANTITTDKTFLVFGDNNGSVALTTAITGTYVNERMARVYKVQKSATWGDQDITLKIKGMGSNNYLVISNDATFTTISQELQLDANGAVTLNSSLLANGAYFTIGAAVKGPGNVTAGVALWLRADDGNASGAQWNDFSGNGNGAAQAATASRATVLPAGVNFNPALNFDGVDDYLQSPSLFTSTGVNNLQIYAVTITDKIANQNIFGEFVSNSQYVHAHVPYADGILYWDAPYGYRAQGAWGGTLGAPYLWSFVKSMATMSASRNRNVVGSFTAAMNNIPGSNSPFVVGAVANGAGPHNGKIAELIVYNNSIATTATQRQQIESYLALKYGLTLSPASPVDYLASDGATKFWDATANTAYRYHITGIGRDSVSALLQKQSLSADTGYLTMALGNSIAASNAANTGTITNDKSFFVASDNGAAKRYTVSVSGLTGVNVALARVWKVQKTNWADQNITFLTDSTLTAPQYLIISTDASFGAGDLMVPVKNRMVTLNTSQLPDGAFFTFANGLRGPGGVITGIGAWYKADYELSRAQWNDFSGNGYNIPQPSVGNRPAVLPVAANFNPAAGFTPPQFFGLGNIVDPATSIFGNVPANANNFAVFGVSAAGAGAVKGGFFDQMTTNGYAIVAAPSFDNTNMYFDAPYSYRVTAPWGGVVGKPNVWSFIKTVSNMTVARDRNVMINDNATRDFGVNNGGNYASNLGVWHSNGYFTGNIPEIIVYRNLTSLTAADRLKIESYLALKYGVTLDLTGVAGYVATDGSTYFDAAANAGYLKHITGIGRDSLTELYQKQSLSVDTGVVTIALGATIALSNAANTAAITDDRSFLVFGDNGATAAYQTQVSGIVGVNNRMNRIFKVDKTNWTDQDITLKVNGGNAQTYLLVSADAIFGAGDAAYVLKADSTVTLNSSNLPDGAYFTFATVIKGPNAITKGLNFWLRADDNVSRGAAWNDYSGYGNNALQNTVAGQPATDAKGINFNYTFKFDGTDDFMDINTTRVHPDSSTIFVAGSGSGFATVRDLVGSGAVGGNQGMEFRMVSPAALQYLENSASVIGISGTSAYVDNKPYLFSTSQSNLANGIKLYQNFRFDNQGTINLSPATANLVSIGSRTIGGRAFFWQGNISEVIVYDRVLPDPERQLVESYLALKYGITLNNGTTAYLASDNSTYWAVDAAYKSRITGIGRDDSTALNTKQSLSVDTGFVTVALGNAIAITNEQNGNAITNDKSFFVFGDNGQYAGNFTVALTGSAHNVTRRMPRVWKVQKTNWADQTITLKIKPLGVDNYMLIGSDPTFATFTQELPVANDGTVTLSSSLFTASDMYFTFGAPLKSPGGVAGHSLWVRADIGTSPGTDNTAISEWSDMSALANTAAQPAAANQPIYLNNTSGNINFNAAVKFNGSSQFMNLDIAKLPMGTSARTLIAVGNPLSVAGAHNSYIVSWGQSLVSQGAALGAYTTGAGVFVGYGDDVVTSTNFWQPSRPNVLFDVWAGAGGAVNLFSKGVQVGGPVNKNWNTTGTIARIGNSSFAATQPEYWNGSVGDIIVYPFALDATQRLKVGTYLSIKYGYTIDQTIANNYLASDGSIIWDATTNATHKKNIAGIGRDDEEALRQKQSRSINTGFQVTIGLGGIDTTNTANTNDFTADMSYLVWGDDSASTSFTSAISGNPAVNYRMTRVWKVQESGIVGNVLVAIPQNTIPESFAAPNLVVSNDATFDGTDTYIPLTKATIGNKKYYTASVDLTTAQYFSFAAFVTAPGGVLGDYLWVKANAGLQVNTSDQVQEWYDQSGSGSIETELRAATLAHTDPITPSADIVKIANGINFNPSLDFSGAVNKSLKGNATVDWNATATTIFGVSVVDGPIAGSAGGVFDGLAEWTANVGNEAGMGIHATTTAYSLDGSGCSPATSTSPSTGVPKAVRGIYTTPGNGLNSILAVNGKIEVAAGASCANNATTLMEVGGRTAGTTTFDNRIFNGKIPEVIVYRSVLSATEINKVESYLAIKYGLTLDQTVATDYVASDASSVWTAATNGIYKNNIGGIGRDDASGLVQKQSRSVNTGMQLAIGLGKLDSTNNANSSSFTADQSFLVWGDDNASAAFKTVVTGSAAVNYRMTRVWKVQESGAVGAVEVAGPYDALPNPRQTYLIVSNDATFDGSDTFIPLYDIVLNGKKHWAAKVDFTTGQYFTIGAYVKSPGGVGATSLWVRADQGIDNNTDGAAVDAWVDFGNEVNTAYQATSANQPVYASNVTDNINYNPVVKFNGASSFLNLDITKLPAGTSARTVIGAGALTNITGNRYMISWGSAALNQGMGLANVGGTGYFVGYTNDLVTGAGFWALNTPNEMFGTWAGAGGQANLYSKIQAVSTPVIKPWNTTGAIARIGNSAWGTEYWNGPITELIVLDRALNNNERQRVSTYLAIRNGYTINQATSYSDYLNTNSTVIWDAAANTGHNINIAGIGRDDIEGLNQKQSKSVQPGAMVAIGLGSIAADNASNTATFVNDTSYMVWGSNSNALTTITTDLPARFSSRLTQEWKVSLSNFDNQLQPIAMVFNLTGVSYTASGASDFNLLVDTDGDGDFTTGTVQTIPATGYNSGDNTVNFGNITTLASNAVFTLAIGPQAVKLTTKVILQGAWNGTAMTTALKTAGVLPTIDPYGLGTTPSVNPNTVTQAVDWIMIELRDPVNPTAVVASRAGLLLSDGRVVDTNYTQPVSFTGLDNGLYKVVIKHRNHLGIMTLNEVDFSSGAATVDFTNAATLTYGTNAQKSLSGGVMGMWAGDVNGDQFIKHSAKLSDASVVANAVLTYAGNAAASPAYTGFINTYNAADVNLDGKVLYTATPSDQAIIINNVKTHPANTFGLPSFIIVQQLP